MIESAAPPARRLHVRALCINVTALASLVSLISLVSPVQARIPEPATPEARAKVAEEAARTAWAAKADSFQLCKSQNQVAQKYRDRLSAEGKPVPEALPTPDCTDPGPFASQAPAQSEKPIESSEAHSPAETAKAPPSSNTPASQTTPTPKQ